MKKLLIGFCLLIPIFIIAQTKSLKLDWAKSLEGSKGHDHISDMVVDDSGNIYSTGLFQGKMDFDPGPDTFFLTPLTNQNDVYILKLDSNGEFEWAISYNVVGPYAYLSLDAVGNLYVSGTFSQSNIDFDPGPDTLELAVGNQGYSGYTLKFNSKGNLMWGKSFYGNGGISVRQISVDDFYKVHITGSFYGTVDFDPSNSTYNLSSKSSFYEDVFVLVLDSSGSFQWSKSYGGIDADDSYFMCSDAMGSTISTGTFVDSADFDPDSLKEYKMYSDTNGDAFICKLDSAGSFSWARSIRTPDSVSNAFIYDVVTDGSQNILVTGVFHGDVDFDLGSGVFNLSAKPWRSCFVLKLSPHGDFIWAYSIDNAEANISTSRIDNSVILAGIFYQTVDFDPGPDTTLLSSIYGWNGFFQKVDSNGKLMHADSWGDPGSVQPSWPHETFSNKIILAGQLYIEADLDPGPDTMMFTAKGSHDIFFTSLESCTRKVATHFDTISACKEYTWLDGVTYTLSTRAPRFDYKRPTGCDSSIGLVLTITHVDTSVAVNSNTITSNATNALYQWLDCENNYALIPNENGRSYTPTQNGSYAVQINRNNCIDTSKCIEITTVDISQYFENSINLFPNPTNGDVVIEFEQAPKHCQIAILNVDGRTFKYLEPRNKRTQINLEGNPGIYFIKIQTEDQVWVEKVVKQ